MDHDCCNVLNIIIPLDDLDLYFTPLKWDGVFVVSEGWARLCKVGIDVILAPLAVYTLN
jgi:hypothetical protein